MTLRSGGPNDSRSGKILILYVPVGTSTKLGMKRLKIHASAPFLLNALYSGRLSGMRPKTFDMQSSKKEKLQTFYLRKEKRVVKSICFSKFRVACGLSYIAFIPGLLPH